MKFINLLILIFFKYLPDSLSDVHIRLADVVEELATSRDPYISYLDYNCQSDGIDFNLKAQISNISVQGHFHVQNVSMHLNISDFTLPSEDDSYQCQILYAAHSETNKVIVDLGELKY